MTCHQAKAVKNGNELSFGVKRETEILFTPSIKAAFPDNMVISALSLLSESFDKYSPFFYYFSLVYLDMVYFRALCHNISPYVCLHFNKR